VQSWQKQPEQKAVVWQHNRLAEARYELTAREQKLLLYVIAMIEPEDEDFKRYIINIGEFAQLANLDKIVFVHKGRLFVSRNVSQAIRTSTLSSSQVTSRN
jgi:hypothetical protein